MFVIGIDPDSDKHGVAIFKSGELTELHKMDRPFLVQTIFEIIDQFGSPVVVSIEDVASNQSTWRASQGANKSAAAKMGHSIGRLHQSQIEIERDLSILIATGDIIMIRQKPSPQWKSGLGIQAFKSATGWTGSSNADTRSAAYMAWLYIMANKKTQKKGFQV